MISLHTQIMTLPDLYSQAYDEEVREAYKCGHRDARIAVARLALKADAVRDELLAALKWVNEHASDDSPAMWTAVSTAIRNAELGAAYVGVDPHSAAGNDFDDERT